jgi:hypothetical protein
MMNGGLIERGRKGRLALVVSLENPTNEAKPKQIKAN